MNQSDPLYILRSHIFEWRVISFTWRHQEIDSEMISISNLHILTYLSVTTDVCSEKQCITTSGWREQDYHCCLHGLSKGIWLHGPSHLAQETCLTLVSLPICRRGLLAIIKTAVREWRQTARYLAIVWYRMESPKEAHWAQFYTFSTLMTSHRPLLRFPTRYLNLYLRDWPRQLWKLP